MRNKIAWFAIAGLFINFGTNAQKIEVGGSLGGLLYKGDIAPALNPRFIRPAGGLFFRYNASRSFSLRFSTVVGQFVADDQYASDPFQRARGIYFRNTVQEFSLDGQYNFRNYKNLRKVKNWTPYVFGGLGFAVYRLRVPGDEGLANKLIYPLGVGVKYEIKRPWSIGLEFGTRFSASDYLDGTGPVTTTVKLQQNDPALKDKYSFLALTISYTFYRLDCPE